MQEVYVVGHADGVCASILLACAHSTCSVSVVCGRAGVIVESELVK